MPKINGNEIRPGNVLEHNGGLWAAVKVDHVKPGKGGAFAQVELRNLRNGSKLNERFRSADKVERVRLEQKDQQFLYETDGMLVFMDAETYEQIELPAEILGERRPFLQDGMTITVEFYDVRGAERDAAAEGHLQGRRDRAGGEGPDGGQQLQAGGPRQRGARSWCRPSSGRTRHRGEHRNDGIRRARLTMLAILPERDLVFAYVQNAGGAAGDRTADRLLAALLAPEG
jgi:translation elongation factor P/translation initiation factor 5A